jgi:hypothetical protein
MMIQSYIANIILCVIINTKQIMNSNSKRKNKKYVHKEITLLHSLRENILSWIIMFIASIFLSYPDINSGIITVFFCYFWYYIIHRIQHTYDLNIANIIHIYHHDHAHTFLSDFTEVILELNFLNGFLPFLYIFNIQFINIWVILLYTFMYITIHIINYTILQVNNVHRLHHQNIQTNHGPDICDIIFGTKSKKNMEVENTDHYIPNIVIGLIIIYVIQLIHRTSEKWRWYLNCAGIVMLIVSFILYVIFSCYLWFFVRSDIEKEIKDKKKRKKRDMKNRKKRKQLIKKEREK